MAGYLDETTSMTTDYSVIEAVSVVSHRLLGSGFKSHTHLRGNSSITSSHYLAITWLINNQKKALKQKHLSFTEVNGETGI